MSKSKITFTVEVDGVNLEWAAEFAESHAYLVQHYSGSEVLWDVEELEA